MNSKDKLKMNFFSKYGLSFSPISFFLKYSYYFLRRLRIVINNINLFKTWFNDF